MRALRRAVVLAGSLIIGGLAAAPVSAQANPPVLGPPSEGKVQRLTLADGTELIGRIVSVTDSTVQFESTIGTTTIRRSMIARIREEARGTTRNGKYYFPSPNATRLLFAPTGRMLGRGEGYLADHDIFLGSMAYGLSNNFTIGGGLSLIPDISLTDQVWFITPKIGVVQRPTFNLAVGALAGTVPSDGDANTAGIVYGVGTWGNPDASFTAGLGYGFVNGDLASRPVVMFGGDLRTAPRVSLVSENYLFPGGTNLRSLGVRLFGVGVSVDIAAVGVGGNGDGFCCAPFLGAVWKW